MDQLYMQYRLRGLTLIQAGYVPDVDGKQKGVQRKCAVFPVHPCFRHILIIVFLREIIFIFKLCLNLETRKKTSAFSCLFLGKPFDD